ncbi:MAG: tetratricopeptide repeat protein [Candidatus Roizmanbacteria bacterium]|nr:MAG: tetratricopeptide repeat protein [Candidatus Roizmanbacteria bacterium]
MSNAAKDSSVFQSIKSFVLLAIVFLFPLFFLPITQDFFVTNKLYLLAFGAIILVAVSAVEFIITKRFVWSKGTFDNTVLLFLLTVILSTLLSSPNKIQALLNPNLGLVAILSFTILYFYLSRSGVTNILKESFDSAQDKFSKGNRLLDLLSLSTVIVSIITIISFFQPLKSASLPAALQFLKAENFNTFGSLLDLSIFLGFFTVLLAVRILSRKSVSDSNRALPKLFPTVLSLLIIASAFALSVFNIVKPIANNQLLFPPLSISWYAAVEVLKNPMTALFGIGVDNFSSIFTQSKDIFYNASSSWQIQSFNASRSTLLHVFTELGVFGLVAFGLIILALIREMVQKVKHQGQSVVNWLPLVYLMAVVFIFPPSLAIVFLFFMMIITLNSHKQEGHTGVTDVNLYQFLPVYLGMAAIAFIFVGFSIYGLLRTYAAEYNFKKSIDGIVANNMKDLYENQRTAIILNPYIERYRINFSQTNLLFANNIAAKASPSAEATAGKPAEKPQLSDQDRQTISQAIQAAIAEAKAAAALNPQKASNWENLANIYRNILFVAQGADVWTISAYQRAIVLDPQNPIYRLNLGGVFYSLNNFDEALKIFEQSTALKPDWSNAHYNLAWAAYQKGDYQRAVNEMQSVLSLLNPKKDEADYKRAQSEIDEFKKKLPKEEESATKSSEVNAAQQLSLPTPPVATVEPKVKLPKEVSP